MRRLKNIAIAPIHPKPAEGYTMPTPTMSMVEKSGFTDRATVALKEHLVAAFATGPLDLMTACVKWGVSDKHLEAMFDWPRGTVRGFKTDHPDLPWDGFVLEQM